ncbi:MAG: erythromycin biosynthesis sensory transduction protein eryC1 [Bacteroidetes bacterium RIFCSPLOWO2_12_FULL_35_15]|nr:MAG: erythromycin biosynthesis sensory transduction protein eryC1 [Bacteroidetes bacterium RIFCSPLOWO2_12_FULL_35_15]
MKIPFVDLKAQYQSIKPEIDEAIGKVITETAFIGGKYVKEFEQLFSKYLNINHIVACANGTDSLEILLKASGVAINDEVIVPAVSWISTSEAVSSVGAKPVFVDIDPISYTIDVKLIESKITPQTKAIIPVHLYGNPADMNEIMLIAKKHNLIVIEDCAQSHGAEIDGKMVGTFGDAASFSFYPGKNLGAYGDAGAMATNDSIIAEKIRMIANHGQLEKHKHLIEGRNSRMDGIHAAVLSAKIKYLDAWTNKRIEIADYYSLLLDKLNVKVPFVKNKSKHVFHLYVILTSKRDALKEHLENQGIETAIHYPTALPLLDAYRSEGYKNSDFPIATDFTSKILSLPIYPELTKEMVMYVVENIKKINE